MEKDDRLGNEEFGKQRASVRNYRMCYKRGIRGYMSIHKHGISEVAQSDSLKLNKPEGTPISFGNLLKYLVSCSRTTKGVPIKIPETAVLKNKQITNFYKYNLPTSELKLIKPPYTYPRILKIITNAQKSRCFPKDQNKVFPIVIIYLRDNFKLLAKTEFAEFMLERSSSDQWQKIEYIQSYILNKYGLSSPFTYKYESILRDYNAKSMIFDSDESLKKDNPMEYAKKLCTVLSYYLLKVHSIELVSAKVTFMRDRKEEFWLSFASDIYIRSIIKQQTELNDQGINSKKLVNVSSINICKAQELIKLMADNFKEMKCRAGLKDIDVVVPDEFKVDRMFSVLRPKSVYKLSEMISPQFNPKELIKQRLEEGWSVSKTDQELPEFVNPNKVRCIHLYKPNTANEVIRRAKSSSSKYGSNRKTLRVNKFRRIELGQLQEKCTSKKCITASISKTSSPNKLFY